MIRLEAGQDQTAEENAWAATGLSRSGLGRFLGVAQRAAGLQGTVDVLLTGDGQLRRLNREFRGKDKATDVLSFPALEVVAAERAGDRQAGCWPAGDVAISLETAARQAKEHGHSLRDEVRVLLLHGLLHLQGMDHERDRGEMAEREAELRARLRLPNGLIARVEAKAKAMQEQKQRPIQGSFASLRMTTKNEGKGKGKGKSKSKSRFPAGMTTKRATVTARANAKAKAKAKEESHGKRGGQ